MTSDEIFDRLHEATHAVIAALPSDSRSAWLAEGGEFSLTRLGRHPDGHWYVATTTVQTASGLTLTLTHRFNDGNGPAALDRDRLVAGVVAAVAAIAADPMIDEQFGRLAEAIEEAYSMARREGIPLRTASLSARPLRLGEPPRIRYELTSTMLDADLHERSFVMRVSDAADFRTCFADEIMPEQRQRAARTRGRHAPEAVND